MALPLRILCVDDSEDDTLLLLRELRKGGWNIAHQRVQTPEAMNAALDTGAWDIIISDYSMPGFNGLAALAIARARAFDLPFILVSGTVGEEVAVVAMKAGAHDYIMKDHLARLVPAVERELHDAESRRRAAHELREAHEHLELRVEQRTAELGQANERLRLEIHERQSAEVQLSALNEELTKAKAAADNSSVAKSNFLANMSHEIRTPISAILGFSDLLLAENQSASDRLDYINTVRRNAEYLLTLINDILDLSKIEAGKLRVDPVACCPCQVLIDVASLMRVRAVDKLIRLEVKNEGPIPASIHTDPGRLRQILINLVGNAIKFTDEGWVRLIMKLDGRPGAAPRLRFDILDTGIGMTREQVGRLFQPFVQADSSTTRRFGGTGLGLTISKHLAEMLGGVIEVDSSPGRGSTFSLFIDPGPLAGVTLLESCREALAGMSLNQPRSTPAIRLDGRVLLVDDGQDNRRLLSHYLSESGAHVTLAENGRIGCSEALAAEARGEPFGVILMDMQMPELDGYSAASLLRSKGYSRPIVALTAHAMAEDRDKCLQAGCTDYLSKPVRRDHLLATVARYLQGSAESASPDPQMSGPAAAGPLTAGIPIRSSLTDVSLQPFLDDYLAGLPARADELRSCLAANDREMLAVVAHNLRGTGGLYGLMPITESATKLETTLQQGGAIAAVTREVDRLIEVIGRVQATGDETMKNGVPSTAALPG